ncbi:unnamed protein product [Merluccius merluccius]
MDDDIKEAVLSFLPGLSDETLTSLLEIFGELGVESRGDLSFIQEKDLERCLRPIQCRRLLNGIKNDGLPPFQTEFVDVASPTPSNPSSSSSENTWPSVALPGRQWYIDFSVRWNEMPAAVQQAVADERRPSPGERRDVVKVVVDQMLAHDPNPTRAMCHSVARRITRDYPTSFADVGKTGDVVVDGCQSLLQQLKTRVEYKNRRNTLARRRGERRPRSGVAEGARVMTRGPVDQYGCVRWGPVELPDGETETTLNEIKRQLLNIYSEEGMGGAERAEPLMVKTYVIQRRYLNSVPAPGIAEIKKEWPFLFTPRGLYSHFGLLTDVSILNKLRETLNNKGSTVIGYCKDLQRHPGIEDVLGSYDPETSDRAPCILLLLMAYFKEPENAIMLKTDPCSTAADVQRTLTLPSTPCLIVQGDMMKPSAWMLSVEGEVVMGPYETFMNGIAAVFASYYSFNLQYPGPILKYWALGINPETGSKSKKKCINSNVSTLVRKLIDFSQWMSG